MKRFILALGFLAAVAAAPASAQTRVELSFGFGVPRPYAYHFRPYYHRSYSYRPYYYRWERPWIVVEPRVLVVPRRVHRRGYYHHRRYW